MFRFAFFALTIVSYLVCVFSQENLIWARIPKFYVDDYVTNFINNHHINNCFYKLENEDSLLLKCWRNNKLFDVEISIKEKKKRQKMFYESISI
jgi:hypothetical protein